MTSRPWGVGRRDYKIIPKIVGGRVIGEFWIISQKISTLLRDKIEAFQYW